MMYDMLVNFKVNSNTEEGAEHKLRLFLKMAQMDFGLTYDISDSELVEFPTEEGNNS